MKRYILLLITLSSCIDFKNCNKEELDITIEGWRRTDTPITKVKLYLYNENFSIKQDSIEPTFILNHLDTKNPEPTEASIIFEESISTKNNYKLIINNKNVYYINKFNVVEEEKYTAIKKKKFCILKSFNVNGVLVSENSPYFSIRFKKNIEK